MNINLFWFKGHLSLLEKLTLNSILFLNYTPVVWTYDKELFTGLDKKIKINDANEIIKEENSFVYKGKGTTRSSYGCGFTDIFRAKLLYEVGGWYSDFDITYLNSLDEFNDYPFVFRKHNITSFVPNLFKAPLKSNFLKMLYESFYNNINEDNNDFFRPLKIFSSIIEKNKLDKYGVDCFGKDDANMIIPLLVKEEPLNIKAIHWCNELFKNVGYDISCLKSDLYTLSLLKKNNLIKNKKIFYNWNSPVQGSTYNFLLKKYET